MKSRYSFIFVFIIALLLGGCASAPNIGKDYSLDEAKGKGILLVSMTRSGDRGFNMFVDLRGVDNKYDQAVPVTDLFASLDWSCPITETSEPCGRLAVIELPQGEYEFYSWHGGSSNGKISTSVKAMNEFSKRFKVTSGKVVYVGNVHLAIGGGRFAMRISDKRDRDLPLFSSKYPKIATDKIQVDIIK